MGSTPALKIDKWDARDIWLSWKDYRYTVKLVEVTESTLSTDMEGAWVAHADSIIAPYNDFEETGQFLMNPQFTFRADSFNIITEDFKGKGKLTLLEGPTKQLVLETSGSYIHHKIAIVEQHSTKNLTIRMQDGKRYQLERGIE